MIARTRYFLLPLLVLLAMVAVIYQPGRALAQTQSPKLVISSVECAPSVASGGPGGVTAHFVLVHNAFTAAQLGSATLTVTGTVDGTTFTSMAATFLGTFGSNAQYNVNLHVMTSNSTVSITGATLVVAAQTINLANSLTQTGVSCGCF
jgi:hypothetical protein